MSFPNPDNYARDCDCGTAGANTTPPPATLLAQTVEQAKAAILTNPFLPPNGGTIDTRNNGGTGGNIFTYSTGNGNGGTIDLSSTSTGTNAPHILCGTGVPTLSAPNGSIFLRVNGTASTTLYVRAVGAWSALS